MHYTSLKSGEAFSESYGIPNGLVIDIGGAKCKWVFALFF
jgi:hypothetical protein